MSLCHLTLCQTEVLQNKITSKSQQVKFQSDCQSRRKPTGWSQNFTNTGWAAVLFSSTSKLMLTSALVPPSSCGAGGVWPAPLLWLRQGKLRCQVSTPLRAASCCVRRTRNFRPCYKNGESLSAVNRKQKIELVNRWIMDAPQMSEKLSIYILFVFWILFKLSTSKNVLRYQYFLHSNLYT